MNEADQAQRMRAVGLVPVLTRREAQKAHPLLDTSSSRILDVLLGALLVVDGISVGAGAFRLPIAEAAGVALVLLAGFRRPRRSLANFGVLGVLAFGLLTFLAVSSTVNGIDDEDWVRRIFRIAVLVCLAGAFASGRLDLRGALHGMITALVINIPLFYAGLAPDTYGGVLTGVLGDKNVAGLYYAVIPVLLIATTTSRRHQVLLFVFAFAGTALTGSRTSLAGLACALIWMIVSPRLGLTVRWILAIGLGLGVYWLSESLPRLGGYFDDRLGSDLLRERIQTASWEKAAEAPWYGLGLGEAHVHLDEATWFFHNSFWGLLAEGGWPFLVIVLSAYVVLGMRPFRHAVRTPSRVAVEASTLIFLVCASQLGEVFITVTGALVLGAGLLLTSAEGGGRATAV
ncbi:O-antigen ligase family protein [Micrococcus terreus]|uniref:O-antigen ligase family protein n=1 Tax=Micrococcus terreus TaxID=574650 RepID=UPI00254C09F6|nr:O-antigen ligase family protein [Micrococcus terreus]MDK7701933.1 O-antigen ligase family protein [Micrococcus terreus]WOO97724.1 O-antigen ligase family protein [Micrococcus terreus]